MNAGRVVGVAVAGLLALSQPLSCVPPHPSPVPPAPEATRSVTFVVEAYAASSTGPRRIVKWVAIAVMTVQDNGQPGNILNPETGEVRRAPYVGVARIGNLTPYRNTVTLGPGIVAASITVRGNARKGERLTCYVEAKGLELRGSRNSSPTQKLISGPVEVSCEYLGGG